LGSASVATRRRIAEMSVENLVAGLRGDPMPACFNESALASPEQG
jgi:hypothetical protein